MAYAWAPIDAGEKKFKLGDSVSAGDLGVEDADFQALLDSGAVREYAPPELPATFQGSVLDFVREQRAKEDVEELVMTGGSTFAPTSADVVLAGFEGATPDEYEEELAKRHEAAVEAAEEEAPKEAPKPKAAAPKAASGSSGS